MICIHANICTVILFGTTFVLRDNIKKQPKARGKNLSTIYYKLYVPVTVHREQSVKKEYQQDATI